MSFINHSTREINCKIIYYGTGLSGKTTNIQYIYENTSDGQKGKLVTLSSENERTLFFDFLPLSIGNVNGFKVRFHLYTIPGQTFYDISREFILKGVDGIVFVVDSQPERMEENIESFELLEKSLDNQGYLISKIPLIFQYNKRDIKDAVPVSELEATFNPHGRQHHEAVAHRGEGVMESLESICELIIQDLKGGDNKYE